MPFWGMARLPPKSPPAHPIERARAGWAGAIRAQAGREQSGGSRVVLSARARASKIRKHGTLAGESREDLCKQAGAGKIYASREIFRETSPPSSVQRDFKGIPNSSRNLKGILDSRQGSGRRDFKFEGRMQGRMTICYQEVGISRPHKSLGQVSLFALVLAPSCSRLLTPASACSRAKYCPARACSRILLAPAQPVHGWLANRGATPHTPVSWRH